MLIFTGNFNREKHIHYNLVVWGDFCEVVQGWQAIFESPQEVQKMRGGVLKKYPSVHSSKIIPITMTMTIQSMISPLL